jgi:ATP-dependent protease Clp ATPase subunit
MVSSTLEPFVNETMFLAPEFSPTVNVKVSVFDSSDEFVATVVGATDVESVVVASPQDANANTARAAKAIFFICPFFQNCSNAKKVTAVTMNRNRSPNLLL